MPQIKTVQREVEEVEGFQIRLIARGVKSSARVESYRAAYLRSARNSFTVNDYIRRRASIIFSNFETHVLFADGTPASGRTKLARIRATY